MRRLFLSRSEKRGLIALLFLLLCVSGGIIYVRVFKGGEVSKTITSADSVALERFSTEVKKRPKYSKGKPKASSELFAFNPNTADSATLVRLGLRSWQIKNLMAYRRAGGRWKDADDFRRLYGLTDEEYQRLRPYVQIPKSAKVQYYTPNDREHQEKLHSLHSDKFEQLTVLDLNEVDTLTLRKIPGIGPGYSRAIVYYRERLGGFVSTAQLKEIDGLPERIEEWFRTDVHPSVRTLSVNKSDFKTLVRHPYLNYEQVKVISTHIRKYGPLRSWDDLSLYPEFTADDFERLRPYFVFD